MSLCNHCNNVCDNDISYVSCKRCTITIITVYQKIIYYHQLFRKIQLLIIYSRFLLAKSISKKITINSDKNTNIICYNISFENIINEILDDFNMSSHFIGKINLNTNNIEAYKVTMDDVITPYLYSELYNLHNRVDKYPKVLLRPDLSFDERVKRPILTIGDEHMTKHTICIFNNRTSQYELRYIVTSDDISYIDWKIFVSYSDVDYLRWSKQAKNINTNMFSDIRNNDILHSNLLNANFSPFSKVYYVRSLCNNLPSLVAMLNDRHYDIIIFTETWLNNSVTYAMLNPLHLYTVYRQDRPDNSRGGIIVYVNITYNSLCMIEFFTNGIEILCINFFNYILVTIYRPPDMPLSQTLLLCDTLNNICSSTDSCIIYGDFNLDCIDWIAGTTLTIAERYVYNKFISYSLTQLINCNTRNSNILDLILTNNTLIIFNISPTRAFEYDAHVSDHFAIYSDLVIPDNYLNSGNLNHFICSIQRLNYNKSDIASIKTHILSLDWNNSISSCNDCNELINTFININKNIIELYTPTFSTTIYKYPLSIKKLLNKCRVLHKNIFDTYTHNVWMYNHYLLSVKIKQYNIDVEHKMISSNKNSSFYNYIITKLNNNNLIPPLRNRVDYNIIYTNDFDKADFLSEQFSSVFLKSHIYYDPFIMKYSRFNDIPISQEIVRTFLCKLTKKFNSSPDDLPKGMLKLLSYDISYPLSIVFNVF